MWFMVLSSWIQIEEVSALVSSRCVLNWFGDWSNHALFQVGREFTQKLDLENSFVCSTNPLSDCSPSNPLLLLQYIPPDYLPVVYEELSRPPTYREVIVNAFVFVHKTLHQANERLAKRGGGTTAITPRHYLDFINHYVSHVAIACCMSGASRCLHDSMCMSALGLVLCIIQ